MIDTLTSLVMLAGAGVWLALGIRMWRLAPKLAQAAEVHLEERAVVTLPHDHGALLAAVQARTAFRRTDRGEA